MEITARHILFHPLKHHYGAITDFVRAGNELPLIESMPGIKTMGASQFDLYTGRLGVAAIKQGIAAILQRDGYTTQNAYSNRIGEHGGFRTAQLPDGSGWTLRYLEQEQFVHIHPSRYGLHTLRIKANAMKSVCCYLIAEGWQAAHMDVTILNRLRAIYLAFHR